MASLRNPPKPDWEPLLPGGVHAMSMDDLHALTVTPFDAPARRAELLACLVTWSVALHGAGVTGKIWCCGSFMTSKPAPQDIDVVLWGSAEPFLAPRDLSHLLGVRNAWQTFGLDLHVEPFHSDLTFFREAHHLGFHGFANDRRTARGIAELIIGS